MKKIEKIILEDGRWAERHTYDMDGKDIVELFVEPAKNLVLEKRIVTQRKEVVASQQIETIQDGVVVNVENLSIETPKMESRGNFVTKSDLVEALSEVMAPSVTSLNTKPVFRAQSIVEERVEEKDKKSETIFYIVCGVLAVVEVVILICLL